MSRHGNLLTYVSFAIVGILLSYNTNFFQVEEVRADQVKPLDLPALKFDPKGNLSLEIDLNKGVSNVKSDMPIANIDVTINHPTKIVEKVVKKQVEVKSQKCQKTLKVKKQTVKVVQKAKAIQVICKKHTNYKSKASLYNQKI